MPTSRLLLIGCVKGKRKGTWPARQLYVSELFSRRRHYAEATGCSWFILSAKHGLVAPDEPIEWYDRALSDVGAHERRRWSESVLKQLDAIVGNVHGTACEVHAGKAYRDFGLVQGLTNRGALVTIPTANWGWGSSSPGMPVSPDTCRRNFANRYPAGTRIR